jgi:hypothetical protein
MKHNWKTIITMEARFRANFLQHPTKATDGLQINYQIAVLTQFESSSHDCNNYTSQLPVNLQFVVVM